MLSSVSTTALTALPSTHGLTSGIFDPSDVRELAALLQPLATVEFNVEGNPFAPAVGDYPGFYSFG